LEILQFNFRNLEGQDEFLSLQKYIVVKISGIEYKTLENLFRMSSKYLKIYQTDKSRNKEISKAKMISKTEEFSSLLEN